MKETDSEKVPPIPNSLNVYPQVMRFAPRIRSIRDPRRELPALASVASVCV